MSDPNYVVISFLLWGLALAATGAFVGVLCSRYRIVIQERK